MERRETTTSAYPRALSPMLIVSYYKIIRGRKVVRGVHGVAGSTASATSDSIAARVARGGMTGIGVYKRLGGSKRPPF